MNSSSPIILIIDPDPIMLTGVAAVLNMQGHECHCASDDVAAMKAAADLPLDLVICDVNIHGKSGIELCDRIRNECGHTDVPVMFVSGTQVADIVRRAHDAGGAYHLRKPFDPDVLIELVDKALWMPHLIRSRMENEGATTDSQEERSAPNSAPAKSNPTRRPGRRESNRESTESQSYSGRLVLARCWQVRRTHQEFIDRSSSSPTLIDRPND